jgi:hypothetical protein
MNILQDTNDPSFYYDNALSHCTSGFIATSSHCTTLEYDECIVVLFSEDVDMPLRVQNIWKYEKTTKYMEINFLKVFELFEKMF